MKTSEGLAFLRLALRRTQSLFVGRLKMGQINNVSIYA